MQVKSIIFKPLQPKCCAWLQLEHVIQFWDDGDRTLQQVREHYLVDDDTLRYIFYINNEAAGYFQSYKIMPNSHNEYTKFARADKINIGIDFFIGNYMFLGKGLAVSILGGFINTYCNPNTRVIADPDLTNSKVLHVYQQYGFNKIGEHLTNSNTYSILAFDI